MTDPLTRRILMAAAAAASAGFAVAAAAQERHPQIEKAIAALDGAKSDLQHAAHDFGGHRVDAIRACDEAIRQLRLALQFANGRR